MSRKSPQEKKALSYARDGRNAYGENDKASRKAIPLRKRLVNRANRHQERVQLDNALGAVDVNAAEKAERKASGKAPKRWSKVPGIPLADWVTSQREKRRGPRRSRLGDPE